MFDFEKLLKEAEQLVDLNGRKIADLNNNMNDFEIDIKKGLQQYSSNDELVNEGQRLYEDIAKDRRALKGIEDQKNAIRKILQKIKNNIGENGLL